MKTSCFQSTIYNPLFAMRIDQVSRVRQTQASHTETSRLPNQNFSVCPSKPPCRRSCEAWKTLHLQLSVQELLLGRACEPLASPKMMKPDQAEQQQHRCVFSGLGKSLISGGDDYRLESVFHESRHNDDS